MRLANQTKNLTLFAVFTAIILILAIPGNPIGFIPLPFIRATTIHIPVIIGALLLGPKHGAFLGFMFGAASLYNNTFNPTPTSFVFSPFINVLGSDKGNWAALLIVFIPRILVGVIPYFIYNEMKKLPKKIAAMDWVAAGIAGSLTNTLLVMNLIYLFFGSTWNAARSAPFEYVYLGILSIIAMNGVPEAIVAGIVTAAVMGALTVVIKKN
jgi:uncharacterized membrane protein